MGQTFEVSCAVGAFYGASVSISFCAAYVPILLCHEETLLGHTCHKIGSYTGYYYK